MATAHYNPNSPNSIFMGEIPEAGTTVEIDFGDELAAKRYAIGYWSIRGLGGPLTMMMCAAKVPFTLFLFDLVERDGSWGSDYVSGKKRIIEEYKTPLFNLPFCIDREREMIIAQSNVIWSYLGEACGFIREEDGVKIKLECEQLLGEIYDLRNVMTGYVYGARVEDPSHVIVTGRKHLKKLESWLELQEDNGATESGVVTHLLNGRFSPPDFHLWELLDQFEAFSKATFGSKPSSPCFFHGLPRLKAFKEGFAALPENRFYLESWLHKELPMNNCIAHFGSLPGPKSYVYGKSAAEATWRNKGVVSLSPEDP